MKLSEKGKIDRIMWVDTSSTFGDTINHYLFWSVSVSDRGRYLWVD